MRFIPVHSKSTSILTLALFGIGLTTACSPSANNDGSGGSHSSGGSTGSGGNSTSSGGNKGSGGTTGSGGTSSSGGTTGSGGSTTSSGGKVGSGGSTTSSGGAVGTGGKGSGGATTGSGGATTGTGGATTGTGGATTGTGGATTGSGGATTGTGGATGSGGTGAGGSVAGCMNTDQSTINIDSSGFICNNQWGIKGAWYCYSSDTSSPCNPTGVIPYNTTSKGMCLSGSIAAGGYDGLGFKVNSGPPGGTDTPGTWDGSKIVGFAITLAPGASGKGTGGSVVGLEYVTPNDLDDNTHKDSPGVTLPGVGTTGSVTYNVLYSDAVLANNATVRRTVDANNLTDVKLIVPPDTVTVAYDFCITKVVPLMAKPSPIVATGTYGPQWKNQKPQAVNGINGYAVQSAPFPDNGNAMTMQVSATATGVGFTYSAGSGFQAPNNGPGSFPAVISGWGPGHDGIQFYGPYQGGKTISQLTSVKSSWTFTMGSSGDAVYDVWFGNSAMPTVPKTELMVWIGNKDKMPLGSKASPGTDVAGRTPYVGTNGTGESVVSYWVATGTSGSASNLDLLQYFTDAASHGYGGLSSGSFLLGIQTGFEVYGGTWTTTDYNITIQ